MLFWGSAYVTRLAVITITVFSVGWMLIFLPVVVTTIMLTLGFRANLLLLGALIVMMILTPGLVVKLLIVVIAIAARKNILYTPMDRARIMESWCMRVRSLSRIYFMFARMLCSVFPVPAIAK